MSVSDQADRLELQSLSNGSSISISSLKEQLETALDGPNIEDNEDGDSTKEGLFERAQEIFDELKGRKDMLNNAYPFRFSGLSLIPEDGWISSTYAFCLALSYLPAAHISNDVRTEFEYITLTAAQNYFRGQGIRTGAPWRTDAIQTYKELLLQITELATELGKPVAEAPPGGGDHGWDLIVVTPFCDRLYPRMLAIGNCATGKYDWRDKGNEVASEHFFSQLFEKSPRGAVIEFFSIPFLLDADMRSRKTTSNKILFDRLRLSEFAENATEKASNWLVAKRVPCQDISLV